MAYFDGIINTVTNCEQRSHKACCRITYISSVTCLYQLSLLSLYFIVCEVGIYCFSVDFFFVKFIGHNLKVPYRLSSLQLLIYKQHLILILHVCIRIRCFWAVARRQVVKIHRRFGTSSLPSPGFKKNAWYKWFV